MIVRHRSGAYPVEFVPYGEALGRLPQASVVVTDQNVARHWDTAPAGSLGTVCMAPGEQQKTLAGLEILLERMAELGASRSSSVAAVGGGVVGDLAGFGAASYMRGVPWVLVPTTLLAMVDSSVGGKVGVDLRAGKNLAGAFHQPAAVWIALETLQTLPEREFVNGAAEVWKYGFILDETLLGRLEESALALGAADLEQVVARCVALKAEIVEADERETIGLRAVLNFGHTIGHALEKVSGYGPLKHGEAISVGMVVEARLGERIGLSPQGTANRVRDGLASQGLPVASEWLDDADTLLAAMARDKKSHGGALAFSLLEGIGKCKLVPDVAPGEVRAALRG